MDRLAEKLAMAKRFMDKHDEIDRSKRIGDNSGRDMTFSESVSVDNVKYDLGDINISENENIGNLPQTTYSNPNILKPVTEGITEDKIRNTKLPEAIKKMLMEKPPVTQSFPSSSSGLDSDTIRKAASLIKNGTSIPPKSIQTEQRQTQSGDNLKSLLKEVVREVLHENGLILEREKDVKEKFKIRIGDHVFIGNIEKVKKFTS